MSFVNTNWWIIPLVITLFSGLLCPAMGTILITHKRLLQVNLISHCVLPGLALALALGVHPSIGGVFSGLLGSLLAEHWTNKRSQNYEAVMNIILAGSLGLGVLLIPLLGIRIDLEAVLFGDLLTANFGDLIRTFLAFFVFACLMIFGYDKLVYVGLDPEGARASGIKVDSLNLALGFTTALVIVSSMSAVGVILVVALLSTPTLWGLIQAPSLWVAMIRSAIFGLCISILGFFLAFQFNLSPGPLISVLCVAGLAILPRKNKS
ncbi:MULTISPECIES: metal ABC transporter permease [Prochlorococcus]|uniref:ABC-type Mn2+/Zn2+ transport system permease components n=1 Tax=Prochlorococcus marinus (strain SARG / CCMP1375 / SS120) TaxID=167539 RepID=Q7VAG2_PROMA|nr:MULTISPECIES: metal ABC transporter permease [Prochlorococcus]AAQ00545.1 ABC-type Mn2+/Zn2+ transport system permease components [Prochlorococcus marinus subsp. marinus str. CCMP1375]KGG10283.1 Zinc ABC transporter [Prochlorococcus marinus str. LG]KGG22631.1 Zinc ABC transporter [Prochlorococcus marinus str. SS2]KGG24217.1 Zinc ABC transporter [Prochlorococcus marinus str. SS35]KGG33170.1 Zinc ABC transporter [Prochlorococcus marinus str. SS51]